ncbi:hypothetical protein TREMEDRAFT_64590 [Tremella mesenterica DSM 1558]|uniref:uncharacterized protein n=1 Tax=Tremella mesenterica (strain ATCC 24925 / CBS 8224 / DSM 1558 / NBRC 9311 / NRRL Y-6157 / RJB 2259-6 / UBC 559-6) TaxID=578456 RepID=UPI0003F48C77|nr:uncharacterized protein TREMEDRAFT_64590 [Tremella mesenterica DSM 1558]EIW67339.1 hypothetical protein TREMEDRAFT_64590 [Tremella mesenterica DSM 1558]
MTISKDIDDIFASSKKPKPSSSIPNTSHISKTHSKSQESHSKAPHVSSVSKKSFKSKHSESDSSSHPSSENSKKDVGSGNGFHVNPQIDTSNTKTTKKKRRHGKEEEKEKETETESLTPVSEKVQIIDTTLPTKSLGKKRRKENEEDEIFRDSKGIRRKTEEGFLIYKESELGIDPTSGGTPLCPFDCDCCF